MKRQISIALAVTFSIIFVLGVIKYMQISKAIAQGKNRKMPPAAVTTFKVEEQNWPKIISAVGTLVSVQGAMLSAEEQGRVNEVSFESGAEVEKGQILVAFDTKVEQAQLKGAKAELQLAKLNFERQQALRERKANSQADVDSALANLQNAEAEVARLEAVIDRKTVIAPFSGKAGVRLVNEGQTLSVGTPVVAVHSFEELYVNFSVPQSVIAELTVGSDVNFSVDAYPGEQFKAKLTTIGSEIDQETRNLLLQAKFSNLDQKLRSGMFVDVELVLPEDRKILAIPASGVNFAPYGDSVYVVNPAQNEGALPTISPQTIQIGERRGDLVSITSGLKAGVEIVSSGTFKLMPGAEVQINNDYSPGTELNPKPADT